MWWFVLLAVPIIAGVIRYRRTMKTLFIESQHGERSIGQILRHVEIQSGTSGQDDEDFDDDRPLTPEEALIERLTGKRPRRKRTQEMVVGSMEYYRIYEDDPVAKPSRSQAVSDALASAVLAFVAGLVLFFVFEVVFGVKILDTEYFEPEGPGVHMVEKAPPQNPTKGAGVQSDIERLTNAQSANEKTPSASGGEETSFEKTPSSRRLTLGITPENFMTEANRLLLAAHGLNRYHALSKETVDDKPVFNMAFNEGLKALGEVEPSTGEITRFTFIKEMGAPLETRNLSNVGAAVGMSVLTGSTHLKMQAMIIQMLGDLHKEKARSYTINHTTVTGFMSDNDKYMVITVRPLPNGR